MALLISRTVKCVVVVVVIVSCVGTVSGASVCVARCAVDVRRFQSIRLRRQRLHRRHASLSAAAGIRRPGSTHWQRTVPQCMYRPRRITS